jgi:4-hydroxythreonine-4-phosphate dehydrogenase
MRALRIALSAGEPAGIGPELVALAIQRGLPGAQLVYIGDPDLLHSAAKVVRCGFTCLRYDPNNTEPSVPDTVYYVPQKLGQANEFGFLRRGNAHYVLNVLSRAAAGCMTGEFDAMVTAPVQKSIINEAGVPFAGHTEFLQQIASCKQVVMLLSTPTLRVALATTHLPLKLVPGAITQSSLRDVLETLNRALQDDFGVLRPRIAVLGLNPHAGENGHLGQEEIEVIIPVLEQLRAQGMELSGPWPADTAFLPDRLKDVDVVLAMYHDQGLPVLKAQGFGEAVNITVGLPFIRTSVDHGTALHLAGKGLANPNSLFAAIDQAYALANLKRERIVRPPIAQPSHA